ncbi:hypothetical protein BST61_g10034 [Cercospora zeina]
MRAGQEPRKSECKLRTLSVQFCSVERSWYLFKKARKPLAPTAVSYNPLSPKKKIRYQPDNQQSFDGSALSDNLHRSSLSEVSLAELQASAHLPILNILSNGLAVSSPYPTTIDTVVTSIDSLAECYPDMQLEGRHCGVRITFRPEVKDIRGIVARLYSIVTNCLRMGTHTLGALDHLEHSLRPLVFWNPSLSAPSVRASLFLDKKSALFLFTYDNRFKIVDLIVRALRERALAVNLGLVLYEVVQGSNFWAALVSCFYMDGQHHEVYEDLVEQKLFLLQMRYPELKLDMAECSK